MAETLPIPCLRCRTNMEPGYLAEKGDGDSIHPAQWVSGAPVEKWWGIKIEDGTAFPVVALRCPACGYIELRTAGGGQ